MNENPADTTPRSRRVRALDPSTLHHHDHRCWWDLMQARWICTGSRRPA